MTFIAVRCPHCQSEQIVKRGKTGCGTQRYLCQNPTCATGSFLLDYRYLGRLPEVKHQIIDMSLNASGVRDTARVLRISTDTVAPATQTTWPWPSSGLGRKPRWTRCSRLSATKAIPAGCGMRSLITRVLSWRMSLGAAKTQSFCSSKRCWSPSGSRVFIPIIGGRTNAISNPTCIVRANGTPRKSSASI